jgi:hypothetical protein
MLCQVQVHLVKDKDIVMKCIHMFPEQLGDAKGCGLESSQFRRHHP